MITKPKLMVTLLIFLYFNSNYAGACEDSMCAQKDTIMRVAEGYIATHYPDFDGSNFKSIIQDKEDIWEVTYELPELTLGGVPVILIDKKTMEVVSGYHTQ